MAAQEHLNADQKEDLPSFCVYGTDPAAWRSIKETRALIPGGLVGNRAVVNFAVSLLGDLGRFFFSDSGRIPASTSSSS